MLVGRGEERRKIGALLSSARIGQGGVLVVTGEPGIGKTALLEDARSRADGMRLLSITGSEAERDLPFAGLAQLLRLAPADLDRLPPPQAEALGVALALRAGDRPDRFAVGAGLLSWVTRQSEDQPLAMIIDDAHLVDRPSQEAIAFAARRLLADAVAVLVAARTGEPCQLVAPDLPQLPLTGLDPAATRELVDRGLVDHGLARSAAAQLSRRILDLAGGNPLAIHELTSEHQQLEDRPPDAPIPVSAVLADLYARRGAELDAEAMTAALVAAAAGEDLAEIAQACERLGIDVSVLAAAETAGLLAVTPDRVHFAHPLIRSGLYSTATPAQRRMVHAAIATALGEDAVDRRAWHRSQAALGPDEPAAADLTSVGQRAAARGAYAVAATAAERAAALSPTSTGRAGRLLAAGTWAWHAGDAGRARTLLDRASRLDRRPEMRVRTQRLLAVIAARSGAVDEARDILLSTAAEASDPAEAVACYAEVINVCFYLGDPAAALLAAERIGPLAEQSGGEAQAVGLMAAGMARVLAGQDGAELLRRGVQLGSGLDRPVIDADSYEASWFLMGPLFLRDSSHGRELVEQAVADQRAKSALGSLPHLLFHIARDEATTDRWPNAEANYTEAVALAREFGQTTELAASLAGLAWLEAREGKVEPTRAHAAEVISLSQIHHVYLTEVWARSALGDLTLGLGDVGDAVTHYTAVEALLARLGVRDVDLSPVPELVEALLRSGEPGRAADLSRRYDERARAKGQPWALARAARTRLLLADDQLLDSAYAEAAALHEATLDAYERARTALVYGGRLRRARRRVDARPVLQLALDTFTQLGAKPWADTAADELAATGIQVSRQGASPVSQLTPRELQIAVLLAEGRTTRQAAGALFLSPKTVEYHLRHVYTKFGIDSRAELAARLSPEA